MQRITNCVYLKDDHVLLLNKPRRGWWALPGGKMEPQESILDGVLREYVEETGVQLQQPTLKGIYTFIMKKEDKVVSEWMMFTFFTTDGLGEEREVTEEGVLKWQPTSEIFNLPMAEGDRQIIQHAIEGNQIQIGVFEYTEDFQLLSQDFKYA